MYIDIQHTKHTSMSDVNSDYIYIYIYWQHGYLFLDFDQMIEYALKNKGNNGRGWLNGTK